VEPVGKNSLLVVGRIAVLKPFNNSSIDQTAGMLDQKLDMLTPMVAQ